MVLYYGAFVVLNHRQCLWYWPGILHVGLTAVTADVHAVGFLNICLTILLWQWTLIGRQDSWPFCELM